MDNQLEPLCQECGDEVEPDELITEDDSHYHAECIDIIRERKRQRRRRTLLRNIQS